MRFALPFFAILVVSWTYGIEAVDTGAKKSVKDIASGYEDLSKSSGVKPVTAAGAEKSVKDLVNLYESYNTNNKEEAKKGLQKGKKHELAKTDTAFDDEDDTECYEDEGILCCEDEDIGCYEDTLCCEDEDLEYMNC